tara:strand:+ start:27289 stop:28656 length:1368 start_codon:yes stop_codon:yes gene_type:complete
MAQSIEITAETPIDDHLIKRRGHLIKLGQLVFGIDGTAVVRALTQFKTNAQLADVIDAKRSPLFAVMDYSNFIEKTDSGWAWPTADDAIAMLDERMAARDKFMKAFEANSGVAPEELQTFLSTFWSRQDLTKLFEEFVATGKLPKEAQAANTAPVKEEVKETEKPAEEPVATKKTGRGISDLPKLAELRAEADRLGVDISDLGRKRSAIFARLQEYSSSQEEAPPDLRVVEDEPIQLHEEPPAEVIEVFEPDESYTEEMPVIPNHTIIQDSIDDLKEEIGRVQTALRGIVGYLDTLMQSHTAMVDMFVKDGYLNEGGELPGIDNDIKNDLSALSGIEDRFGLAPVEEEEEVVVNGHVGSAMPDIVTEIEQSLVAPPIQEEPATEGVVIEASPSVEGPILDKIKDGHVPARDELRSLDLEELREIAGYLGVPDPHTKVYKQGLIRQVISLASRGPQ